MNAQQLYRFSGFGLFGGGILFAIGNLLHPLQHNHAAYLSPTWASAHITFSIGAALMAVSMAGFFAWQAQRAGWLGLIGYLLTGLGLAYLPVSGYFEAFIAPKVGDDLLAAIQASSGPIDGIGGLIYLFGHIILAIATFRARVYSRIPTLIMIIGFVTLVACTPFDSPIAGAFIIGGTVLVGVAFAWYGTTLIAANRAEKRSVAPLASESAQAA